MVVRIYGKYCLRKIQVQERKKNGVEKRIEAELQMLVAVAVAAVGIVFARERYFRSADPLCWSAR